VGDEFVSSDKHVVSVENMHCYMFLRWKGSYSDFFLRALEALIYRVVVVSV